MSAGSPSILSSIIEVRHGVRGRSRAQDGVPTSGGNAARGRAAGHGAVHQPGGAGDGGEPPASPSHLERHPSHHA